MRLDISKKIGEDIKISSFKKSTNLYQLNKFEDI